MLTLLFSIYLGMAVHGPQPTSGCIQGGKPIIRADGCHVTQQYTPAPKPIIR